MYKIRLSPYHKIFYNEWKLDPFSNKYNIVFDQTLSHNLDIQRLQKALYRFISDYIILNSHILHDNDELYWVKNSYINNLEFFADGYTKKQIYDYVSAPFDLEKSPLYRFGLFKEANSCYRFIVVLHHILIDGMAFDNFITDISTYYNNPNHVTVYSLEQQIQKIVSTVNKFCINLANSTSQNQQFWHNSLLDTYAADIRFARLYSYSQVTKDHLNHVKELRFHFDKNKLVQLEYVRDKYGLSPYFYGQMILAILLFKYTSQEKFVISYPVNIKTRENLIFGAEINTNIFPYILNNETTISDLIQQINSSKTDIHKHYMYPITNIIEGKNKNLLDVLFAQTNLKHSPLTFTNVEIISINNEFNIDLPTKLLFEQELSEGNLNYRVRFNELEIDEFILKQFITHYKKLFASVLNDLNRNITDRLSNSYSVLDKAEYKKIVYTFNKTNRSYSKDKTIQQLFEEQTAKTPDNIAIICENIQLSYRELNNKSNQLAHYLRQTYKTNGDDLIALCLDRDENMIISILAVLKAGGAYVPIDPDYPDKRIFYILEDTCTKIIITNNYYSRRICILAKQVNSFHYFNPKMVVSIDSKYILNKLTKCQISNPNVNITSNNLAYVMYTSGTTGQPKGVMIEHTNITNFILKNTHLTIKNSVMLSCSNYTFDGYIFDSLFSLLTMGTFILLHKDTILDIKKIKECIKTYNINSAFITTALFNEYAKYGKKNPFLLLKRVLFGGEQANLNIINQFLENTRKPSLFHVYGTTETSVFATFYECTINNLKIIPIGNKLNDKTCYILDSNLNVLPIGSIGELYIGGNGTARGYLNLPQLTNKKFIPNPFQTNQEKEQNINGILYKTGDLVRFLPDGNIEFIGRKDSQVKIRGFRIELKEIENTLMSYSGIKQVIILLKTNIKDDLDKYLTAYYLAENKLEEQLLQAYLSLLLPEYMLPRYFVFIKEIPLTVNGKIDYLALPQPQNISNDINYLSPRNNLEVLICKTYANILKVPQQQIGINQDFFKLGGNSILAIRLVAKLQQNFKISVNEVFKLRTPAKIAEIALFVKDNLKHRLNQVKLMYKKLDNYSIEDNKTSSIKKQQYWQLINQISFKKQFKSINNVLLTGTTGHLGCNILKQLLSETKYTIYLLVRANSVKHAYNRVNNKYQMYFDDNLDAYKNRIVIFPADLEKSNLDLSRVKYQKLIDNIDSIIHTAALVKHYGNYEEFNSANVTATINLLDLAKQTNLKDFHYISTIGIFMEGYVPDYTYYTFTENDNGDNLQSRNNFYTETKYRGELSVLKYRNYGVKSNIYRVGNLAMNSENYRNQENIKNNAFFHRVKTILNVGIMPKEISSTEISPVNCTALAIVKLFNQEQLSNNCYHVFNPYKVDLFEIFAKNKKNIIQVSLDNFINEILKYLEDSDNSEVIELFMLHQGWLQDIDPHHLTKIDVLSDKTNDILNTLGFYWPHVTYTMLSDFINQCYTE